MRLVSTLSLLFFSCFVTGAQEAKPIGRGLNIFHLTNGFYIYTTYYRSGTTSTPSNSMYLVTDNHVVLFDTPWDTAQFQPLLDSIEKKHHKPVIACIVTHYHTDRTAGLQYYSGKGIDTWSSGLTYSLSSQKKMVQAGHYFTRDTVFKIDNYTFETYFPGPGHTEDNIVIWFPSDRVLYAGCLVKSTDYKTMGNIPDADINEWAASVRNVIKKYPRAAFVIPGHFSWTGKNALQHTIRLVRRKKRES